MWKWVFAVALVTLASSTSASAFEWLGYRSGMTVEEAGRVEGTALSVVPLSENGRAMATPIGDVSLDFCQGRLFSVSKQAGDFEGYLKFVSEAKAAYGTPAEVAPSPNAAFHSFSLHWRAGEHDRYSVMLAVNADTLSVQRGFTDEAVRDLCK